MVLGSVFWGIVTNVLLVKVHEKFSGTPFFECSFFRLGLLLHFFRPYGVLVWNWRTSIARQLVFWEFGIFLSLNDCNPCQEDVFLIIGQQTSAINHLRSQKVFGTHSIHFRCFLWSARAYGKTRCTNSFSADIRHRQEILWKRANISAPMIPREIFLLTEFEKSLGYIFFREDFRKFMFSSAEMWKLEFFY